MVELKLKNPGNVISGNMKYTSGNSYHVPDDEAERLLALTNTAGVPLFVEVSRTTPRTVKEVEAAPPAKPEPTPAAKPAATKAPAKKTTGGHKTRTIRTGGSKRKTSGTKAKKPAPKASDVEEI